MPGKPGSDTDARSPVDEVREPPPALKLVAATRVLLEATAYATGAAFFRGLARGIAQALGVRAGLVGELTPDQRSVRTKGVWWGDWYADDFTYTLSGSPCEGVLAAGVSYHPADVQQLYPDDRLLAELGVHAYVGVPVRNPEGQVLGILVAMHDAPTHHLPIDELEAIFHLFAARAAAELARIASDERLRASEARYRQIVTSCHEGVWTIDAAGITTFVNAQMAEMLGYGVDEMIGRPLHDFMDAEARRMSDANLERRRRGISERHSFRFRSKDGRDVWTVLSTSPLLDEEGRYVGALALASDETERRTLELKIQHAQKLESLGVLAGGIAHDFNNLLVAVLGNAGLAKMKLPADSPARQPLADVETAAMRAADLTRQLLAYSGRGRFVVEAANLNALVEEMVLLLRTVVSKRADLRLSLARELPDVDVDATQLRQVVMNLVTNASDALGDRDGTVWIATGVQNVSGADLDASYMNQIPPGSYVFLEVRDTGDGMDQGTVRRIFDPFFTTKTTGRGLGLAAVLGILRGHHGSVKVDSEPGKGSAFRVLLPHGQKSARGRRPDEAADDGARRVGVVLLADDDADVRRVAQRVLEEAGYEVRLAVDGRDAVTQFQRDRETITAVVLDVTMPHLDGTEALARIRALRPDVPAVLSSGYTDQDVQGTAVFLRKPWTPAELFDAVERSLRQRV